MSASPIVVRNIYVMLAYAFRAIRSDGTSRVATENFEHLHDLLAEILVRGTAAQVKRGIHRDYAQRTEELAGVRGRINITSTIGQRSGTRGRLVCEFDEYEADTPHNRALKSTMVLLLRRGEVDAARKDALRRTLPHLDAVTLIAPTDIRWGELTYHRSNATYRLLLGVCELVVRGLLPTQGAGQRRLASWLADEEASRLYERFLREYFRIHHPELMPAAPLVPWDLDEPVAALSQLPQMRTDLVLRDGGRTLIVDAKYYSSSLQQGAWGKATIHSAHLYQLLAYVKNQDVGQDGSVSGLLLYARTRERAQPELDVVVQGNRLMARTLDLDLPWEQLRDQLENAVAGCWGRAGR